ncbi:A1S_2505 family phage non-structural protein [Mucilaginibacter endophyticus]|uniref:A1S_2505 family phage non-structural protein n=1 Tax=Mucilaginibacter endophyticus TaxID=2675003 RepID=UPI001ABFCFD9|nr:hypothetical protein [Mucilaginibacter endophyticus]
MKIKITPSKITKLKKNEVFVFGSNLLGNHAGGAARLAVEQFGAINGQAEGLQGQSYAIPTLNKNMEKISLDVLQYHVNKFANDVEATPKLQFLLTDVGCGIAGFKAEEVAPLFTELYKKNLPNISFPKSFVDLLITEGPVVPGFKGFDKGMNCRGYQYSENAEFFHDQEPSLCNHGFHFCESPLDVFNYYPPEIGREYAHVEAFGAVEKDGDKTATNKLRVKAKLSLGKLFKLHFEVVSDSIKAAVEKIKSSTETTTTAGYKAHANTAGNKAHASVKGRDSIAVSLGIEGLKGLLAAGS